MFVAGQNHDTVILSAWHRVPRVMHYQIHDCFLSCTSTLLQNILFQATIRNELQIAVNGITTTPWVRESAQPQKNGTIIRQGMQKTRIWHRIQLSLADAAKEIRDTQVALSG